MKRLTYILLFRNSYAWAKIVVLVLLTVAAMRLGSWVLGWVLARLFPNHQKTTSTLSNLVAFSVFVLLLYKDLMPGEPMDWAAVVFGLVVYIQCLRSRIFSGPEDRGWPINDSNSLTPLTMIGSIS